MKKTLYIIYCIAILGLAVGLAGCMKGEFNPPDKPDPITPPNPNSKHLIEPDNSLLEPAPLPTIIDAEPCKE